MDRNQATGLILMSLLIFSYFWLFPPQETPEYIEPTEQTSSVTQESTNQPTATTTAVAAESDSLALSQFGIFGNAMRGEAQYVALENEVLSVKLNTKGAVVTRVELKNFKTHDGQELILLEESNNKIDKLIPTANGPINLSDLYYASDIKEFKTEAGDSLSLVFTADLGNGKSVQHSYGLNEGDYRLHYKLKLIGLNSEVNGENWTLNWTKDMKKFELDLSQSRSNATINRYTLAKDFDGLSERSDSEEIEEINEPVKWVSLKQTFFNSSFIAKHSITSAKIRTLVPAQSQDIVKNAFAELKLPLEEIKNQGGEYTFYFGPNNYKLLKSIEPGFEKNIYLGWFPVSLVNKYLIINTFNFLEQYISNYGLIILLLVLFIKLLLSPLSYKSYVSMAKMKVLQPEINALKEKHDNDMTKVQQEQMQLFQKVGVNPLSGCIPMLLQMPILFAMFYFFPSSIELRQESFLWATDLSSYDSILTLPFKIPFYGDHVSLFTILMTITTILTMRFQGNSNALQGPMKTMMYIMPVMFLFVLNSFPAALTYYYFVANLITFGQQLVIRKMIDEDKIKQILEENKKRNANKKKSKFQQRLEDAMKASKEKAEQKKVGPKKK